MIKIKRNCRGVTLVEVVLASAAAVIVLFIVARYGTYFLTFNMRTAARQEVLSKSRSAVDLILQQLRKGKAGTLFISTHGVGPMVPNSHVEFTFQTPLPSGAVKYAIFLENGTVYTKVLLPAPQPRQPIATNVTGLMFTGSSIDPSLVNVTLRMDKPVDATNQAGRVSTIILANQTARMGESP